MIHQVNTEEFWLQMCRPGFLRLSQHSGANGAERFVTAVPPEHIPGHFESVIAGIKNDLNYR